MAKVREFRRQTRAQRARARSLAPARTLAHAELHREAGGRAAQNDTIIISLHIIYYNIIYYNLIIVPELHRDPGGRAVRRLFPLCNVINNINIFN